MPRPSHEPSILTLDGLQALFDALRADGFRLVGPTRRDEAIVYAEIERLDDLPRGWTDEQAPGRYRLHRRADAALFGYAVGPHAWKAYLHPSIQRLWRARRQGDAVAVTPEPPPTERYAFIGVRACELKAIGVQDRVLMGDAYADPRYRARREAAFIVAVNCAAPAGTCFCASMDAGPAVRSGHDLALTELIDAGGHRFLVEVGADAGAAVLDRIPRRPATAEEVAAARAVSERAAAAMGREMATEGLRELLLDNLEHPRWQDVADRCLTCGNCTMVCPTCFCTSAEDSSDLTGAESERSMRWDSCFTLDFSHVPGGSVRASARSRYRQWMTHKLATWHDQFGESGCVGCGRCLTWCPVGIDITEEVRAIRGAAASEGV
jgi:ferredoxin